MPLARLSFVNLLIMTALREVDQDDHDISRKAAAEFGKLYTEKFASALDITPGLIARFLLMWMSIISDRDEQWLSAILLLLEITVQVPIASLTMSERFITVDRSSFGTTNAVTTCTKIVSAYEKPDFNGDWDSVYKLVPGLKEIFQLARRALDGMFAFDGVPYQSFHGLGSSDLPACLKILTLDFHDVTYASVSKDWSLWLGSSHIAGEPMKPFLDAVLAGKVRLVCNGAALPVVRPGPDIRSTLQLIVDAVRQSDPQTFTITIAAGDALLGAETVTMRNVVTYCQTLIRQSESVYGKSEYRDSATPFVAPVFKQGQATRTICNVCGGVGHYGRDCATSKVIAPPR